jgi:hypothetical protein
MALYNNVPKGGDIKCPAIRYFYYVIANTVWALNEFTRVNKEDMLVLAKAAIPKCIMMPNLGAILLFYLKFDYSLNLEQFFKSERILKSEHF